MAGTKGSGWVGVTLLYQKCEICTKKKVIYQPIEGVKPFKCTACKERYLCSNLIRQTYA
ncbi:hypothetical protein [Aureibaculum luteum]|uniref:hypothetical protein n=1 Tax=Aureibaculum luteum TaxID=1548456 RepID=UPI001300653F|nr:hypothetical protein [Aureibaculum luteum]